MESAKIFFAEIASNAQKEGHRERWRDGSARHKRSSMFWRWIRTNKKRLQEDRKEIKQQQLAFLANVNHQIRTPLNLIAGYTDLLIQRTPPKDRETSKFLITIADASDRIERSLRTLVDLSQIEAGLFTVVPTTVNLYSLIHLRLRKFQPLAERKGTRLNFEIEEPEITITVDGYCLEQALAQLLDNAVKFTNHGEVRVRVYRLADRTIRINIEDTGIGIDVSDLSKLQQPFSLEQVALHAEYSGGLGLALARRYIELMGAELLIKSVKGNGSVFTIRLPIR